MDGTVLTANDSYLKMFGYTLAEILGQPYALFVNPADREAAEYRALWEHMRAGQYEQGRFRRAGKNGREVWVRASFNPLIGQDGKPWKVVKFASEITPIILEARAFDSAVHESQDVIQAALSGAGDRRISYERQDRKSRATDAQHQPTDRQRFNDGGGNDAGRAAGRRGRSYVASEG